MPVRETFWNIPHWAEISQYILGLLAVAIFAIGFLRRVKTWRKGKPERRSDQLWRRIKSVVVHGLAQVKLAKDPYAGVMHLTIFWGMATLIIGTALATIDWDITRLIYDFQFLKGSIYFVYELTLDILGFLLVVGLGMAVYRRIVIRPARLKYSPDLNFGWDDAFVLLMLSLIAITGYLIEGIRLAVVQPDWAAWSPIGRAIVGLFIYSGEQTMRDWYVGVWVVHALSAFGLIASVPFTKLIHAITSPLNIFYRSLLPAGKLPAARTNSGPGVSQIEHFTWKQLMDFESCTRCGRCQDQCEVYRSGMGCSPRDFILKLDNALWANKNGKALVGDIFSEKDIWACATCRACSEACPVFVDHVSAMVDLRRALVDQGRMDTRLQEALSNLGRYGNSFGQSDRMRARWTQPLTTKIKDIRREPAEYLWFVGDYCSYSAGLADVTRKTAEILHNMGIDFGILYDGEKNAGNDVRRTGEEGLFEMLVEKNMAVMEKCQFQTILTTDPHSYNTLKNEYPLPTNGHPSVLHLSELLDKQLHSGALKFSKKLDYNVTYHDPCYLGRYNEVYEAPRRVIAATGCKLKEMRRHAEQSFCCGAGGGRIWMEEGEVKERPSEIRIREAAAIPGLEVFVVACPKDVTMYRDAVKTAGFESQIQVKELAELVQEAL